MKQLLLTLLFIPCCVSAQLKINEIMPKNVSAVKDDVGDYSMWVELYNSGNTTLNLNNFYFTDDKSAPTKWKPASKSIAAKGYGIVWFERSEYSGHANFKLSPEGGALYLMDNNRNVVDEVSYPEQYRNISYGRKTDGAGEWGYFINYSLGTSNNNQKHTFSICKNPVFNTPGGFYSGTVSFGFENPLSGDTIYYSTNGLEPTRSNSRYIPGQKISINKTSIIRARSFSADKLPSEVVSISYFINERDFDLPVISIITEPDNLTANGINVYRSEKYNNNVRTRPANFELFDQEKKSCLNQELDIAVTGGNGSRTNLQSSLKLSPRKKFGDNRLRYDFFPYSKPGKKFKGLQLRNSGNDWPNSMMRDGFMQTLIANRTDIDYLAYQPAIIFLNGEYFGILNIRERATKHFLYTNYGLDDDRDEFYIIERHWQGLDETKSNVDFINLMNLVNNNDMTQANIYKKVTEMMDVDNFADYVLAQLYYDNTDWPFNNMKAWKEKVNGKWRWILYDTDWGFGQQSSANNNTLTYLLNSKENIAILFQKLLLNETFKNKFADRACIHLSSTFETSRVDHILDSLASNISTEIRFHKTRWSLNQNFDSEISKMKAFSSIRADKMFGFLSSANIQTINISSNIPEASYKFNSEKIIDNKILLKSYKGKSIKIEPDKIPRYEFKHWKIEDDNSESTVQTILPPCDNWKYFDGNASPGVNWNQASFDDSSWKSGIAPLGYGKLVHTTTIDYGPNANNKYPTAYFRKKIDITDLDNKDNFSATIHVDDGAAVYVNGTEIGRYNLPAGTLSYNTYAINVNDGETVRFNFSKNLLKEGSNLIAIEVHQANAGSSDLVIDLSISCYVKAKEEDGNAIIQTDPLFSSTLTKNIKLTAIYDKSNIIDPNEIAEIYINEIVSSNSVYRDEYFNASDYVELYNGGDEDVNIAGWYISDRISDLTLHQIPTTDSIKTNIPAKGRIILWFDKKPELGVLHVSKGLSKDGEAVILSRRDIWDVVNIMDMVTFPALDKNMSYSRVPDGSDNWLIQRPTFDAPNSYLNIIDEISHKFRIYPTVVKEFVIIENAMNERIIITDISGKVMNSFICPSNMEIMSLEHLQKGVYIITVCNKPNKIIKQ